MAFGGGRTRRNLEAAKRDLDSDRVAVRREAAEDLGHLGSEEAAVALTAALDDPAPDVRSAALLALVDTGEAASTAEAEIVARLHDAAFDVRQSALIAVGELRFRSGLEAVERALSAPEPALRFQAVIAHPRLAAYDDAVQALLRASEDADPLVRRIALRMGEELGPEDGGDAVAAALLARGRALLDDPDRGVGLVAAIILARSGDRSGSALLIQAVADGAADAEDESAAIELSGALGLEKATAALEQRAFGGNPLRRDPFVWQARVALARMDHPRAVQWVLRELRAWTKERRTLAVAAAGQARLERARPIIERMKSQSGRAEPETIAYALDLLGPPPPP